jgi:hypothetical protein
MKPRLATSIEFKNGKKLELFISSQKAPSHAWQHTGERPKLTWKFDGSMVSYRQASMLLLKKEKGEL